MKYLKRFNESVIFNSEMIGEIKQTIKDILLPISDMGYEISVTDEILTEDQASSKITHNGVLTGFIIRVVRYTDSPLKMSDEVFDEFIRMNDYLESLGINSVEAVHYFDNDWQVRKIVDFLEFLGTGSVAWRRSMKNCELRNLLFVAR